MLSCFLDDWLGNDKTYLFDRKNTKERLKDEEFLV